MSLPAGASRSTALRKRMNSRWRWRCMQRPITVPSSTLSAANRVEGLDLALFVNRQQDRMGRWIDVEPNDVGELGGKAGIARAFEGAQPVRLQFVRPPDALHRTQRDACCLGPRPAAPV